ncbi:hypothetical protein [Clostridium sp. HMP27]|uniref:hypothetical protein n=1 Tax=Clostridium sp. HMP27 TaxID=1487921 RepID=UPI00052BB54D|nr:hypothetical protein [Clostridium sp. HMP27]KGK90131.1 hypothetical protein DP68_01535 [Clostridium sp. HMP27]
MDNNINWLEPWEDLCTNPSYFEKEFYNEVGEQHVLYGKRVVAIGRRYDCDEVLFQVHDSKFGFAVVHLTYSKGREDDPKYPKTKVYKDLNDWISKCMISDHLEYMTNEEE